MSSTQRTASRVLHASVGGAVLAAAVVAGVPAHAAPKGHVAVTICHSAAGKKFVQITVDASSVDFQGHGGHSADIIPPVNGFPGLNWDAQGSAIYLNGCRPVTLPDTDRDGIIDLKDPDDDGDGLLDVVDTDDDGDGTPDAIDPDEPMKQDTDGDHIPNALDGDDDGDGIGDAVDPDADGDNIPDTKDDDVAPPSDLDHDKVPDAIDADDDGDCIADAKDADRDGDGVVDAKDNDLDNDGVVNALDADEDGDGVPNVVDADANGDGAAEEVRTEDDVPAPTALSERVQRVAQCEGPPTSFGTSDTDGDGKPNVTDSDNDNDGIPDSSDRDQDGDGVINERDGDADGDGQPETTPQDPVVPLAKIGTVPAEGTVTLMPRSETTNAQQPVSVRVTCRAVVQVRGRAAGDVAPKQVRRCDVKSVGDSVVLETDIHGAARITVHFSAPAAGAYAAYDDVQTFTVG